MILVIGANGTVGSRVVKHLEAAGERVRVLVRDASKAKALGGGVEIAVGDLARRETLAGAFEGVEKVFLLSMGPEAVEMNAIDAAKAANVRHVVKFSSMGFGKTRDALSIGNWHRKAEAYLEKSGIAWTVVLGGGFNSNALGWAPTIKSQGAAFSATGEGRVAVVDPEDLAAVAAKVLTTNGHEGKRYELTGPEALSFADQVAIIGDAIGKTIRAVEIPPAAARDAMLKTGMPSPMVEGMLEVMAAIKSGEAATITPTVEHLLGKKPRTFAAWARENAGAFSL